MKLLDYQYEFCMRLFGWVRWSDHFKRWVRRFRKSSLWVAKKNAKSPLGAAVGKQQSKDREQQTRSWLLPAGVGYLDSTGHRSPECYSPGEGVAIADLHTGC